MPKRIAPLSETQVRNAKAKEKDLKLFDGRGLYLLVTPSGGKLWRFKYLFEGKEKLISFGSYPEISLSEARERREAARKQLQNDIDPGAARKAQRFAKAVEAGNAFEVVAREWHERFKKKWSEDHSKRIMTRLEQDVFPFIGQRPIGEIEAPEVLTVLRRVETRTLETAHRIKIACGQIFRYAIATGRAKRDPTADLKEALPPIIYNHFAAPTDPKDVAPLLRAIDAYTGSFVVKCALQIAPLVFVRPGELRRMEWGEIDFDAKLWEIPGSKMKKGLPHVVPLSRQALTVLESLRPLTGRSPYVFPCHRSYLRCMSENAVNAALRRMGFERSEITGHGFRATARTILDERLGFRPDIIDHQLAHAVKDPNGRAYNRTTYLDDRTRMMQEWADYLGRLK